MQQICLKTVFVRDCMSKAIMLRQQDLSSRESATWAVTGNGSGDIKGQPVGVYRTAYPLFQREPLYREQPSAQGATS